MICYTRNFEDVILQRVFLDVPDGCYIDVGASIPFNDSNTYGLYQKGWRGVAIEPLPYYQQIWEQIRPEDVLLSVAVGEKTGSLTLNVYDQALQISSGSADTVKQWQNNCGWQPSRKVEVPMLTLNQVIAEYLPNRSLHLLSIDVEGMENQVLNGLDLTSYRPWVIVIEATVPGTSTSAHQSWEPCLLLAGYSMVYFDGVNRFYLAPEHHDLLERFALPPNVWDRFEMAEQIKLKARIAELERQLANVNDHRLKERV